MAGNNNRDALIGNGACFLAYLIFGFNIVFCKSIANSGVISPMALFLLRSLGALTLFALAWTVSGIIRRIRARGESGEIVQKKGTGMEVRDLWKVAIASLLGLFLTQFTFLKAITMTTAVDAAILSLLSPVMAMIIAAIFLKDKITLNGTIGLAISLAGVSFVVLNTASGRTGAESTSIWGVLLLIANTLCFASYVGIFKPLIQKYSVVTFMTWMFLFSALYALPFGLKDLLAVDFAGMERVTAWQLAFVVVAATFISYFLIPIGQKRLRPVVVCMYCYVQPVVAMAISLAVGLDTMSWGKAIATLCIFLGVGIVNFAKDK